MLDTVGAAVAAAVTEEDRVARLLVEVGLVVPEPVPDTVAGAVTVVEGDAVLSAVKVPVTDSVVDDVTVGAAVPVPDILAV